MQASSTTVRRHTRSVDDGHTLQSKGLCYLVAVVSEMLSTPPAGEWNPLPTPQFMTPSATWRVQHSAYKRTRQNYNRGQRERMTLLLPLPTRVKEAKEKGAAAAQRSSEYHTSDKLFSTSRCEGANETLPETSSFFFFFFFFFSSCCRCSPPFCFSFSYYFLISFPLAA